MPTYWQFGGLFNYGLLDVEERENLRQFHREPRTFYREPRTFYRISMTFCGTSNEKPN
jgi:hypothetical protein